MAITGTKRLLIAAAAAIGAFLFTGACDTAYGATLENTSDTDGEVVLETVSPFTNLVYTHESKFEGYELFNGIDVSKWNNLEEEDGVIDWAACKEAGVDFAFIRVAYRKMDSGKIEVDPYYEQNIEGALENDISVGVYFFSEALTVAEAKEEAKYLIKCIKKYDVTLPLVIDYEGGSYTANGKSYPGRVAKAYEDGTLTKKSATKIIRAFCKYVENAGYTPMIYANSNYLLGYMDGAALAEDYQVWQARYAQSTNPSSGYLYYEGDYDYWQYSESGYIGSIKYDCNFLYKDFNVKSSEPYVSDLTSDSVTIEWDTTDDAVGYNVYRLNPDTGKYQKIGTTRDCLYTDEGLSAVTEYTYRIRAYWTIGGTTYHAKNSTSVSGSTTAKQVKNLTASAQTGDSITLSWKAVSKAKGYTIYQYDKKADEYLEIASVSGKKNTTYQVTGLSGSKEYQFIVCAYTKYNGERLLGEDSEELFARTNPIKIKSLTSSAKTSKSITLSFSTQARVTGYIVYRYDSKAGKWKKLGTSTDGTYKDTTVASNKTYKYRVRAYRQIGDVTYYGKYSKTLTVKSAKSKK
jgi:GH25 family lysozyme M1 (1,4-beta-N-acetylmuramidase)